MDVTKPSEFKRFGDIHGPKPYEFIGFRWAYEGTGSGIRPDPPAEGPPDQPAARRPPAPSSARRAWRSVRSLFFLF